MGATLVTQPRAYLDIVTMQWFLGGRYKKTYFDMGTFNPHAPSCSSQTLSIPQCESLSVCSMLRKGLET